MVSRANLSDRPGPDGVLKRVMNPRKPRIQRPQVSGPSGEMDAMNQNPASEAGGLSGMLGRAFTEAKEAQAAQAERATKPTPPPQAPVPRSRTRADLNPQERAETRMRGQARRQRTGLEQMGATQGEIATVPGGVVRRAAVSAGRSLPGNRGYISEEMAARAAEAQEATGEVGGTRSEVDVTEPSLNEARQRRSRSGRIFRR